jgi:hypothetical protein
MIDLIFIDVCGTDHLVNLGPVEASGPICCPLCGDDDVRPFADADPGQRVVPSLLARRGVQAVDVAAGGGDQPVPVRQRGM